MAVYVDPIQTTLKSPKWPYKHGCHLIGDQEDELHSFAAAIGLRLSWFQKNSVLPHYDITSNKRKCAIRKGAIEITIQQMALKIRHAREMKCKHE